MTQDEIKVIASLLEANQINTKSVLTTEEAAKYVYANLKVYHP